MNRRNWIKSTTVALGSSCLYGRGFANGDAELPRKPSSHGFTNLSINENQFGPSPSAKKAMHSSVDHAFEYPLEAQDQLRRLIAQHENVDPNQVILGAGSSDITMAASNCFGLRGGNIVSSDPSFHPLMIWAKKFGVEHIKIPWTSDHLVDLERIENSITEATSLVYICNPENPVGTVLDTDALKSFCQRVSKKCPVLVDEAYIDYAGDVSSLTMMDCVRNDYPVIILRTFSKAYGLGGMRVGYAVTTPDLAKSLSEYYVTGIGCGCSHASLKAAIAAYSDTEWMNKVRVWTAESKSLLCEYFDSRGQAYIPSRTTFVLAPIDKDPNQVTDAIFGAFKIKISPRAYFEKNYLRISMGTQPQMQKLIEALSYVL